MNIAHIHSSTGFSGGERQVFMLIEGLIGRGVPCTLFAQERSWSFRYAQEHDIPALPIAPRHAWDATNVWQMRRALRQGGYTHAHLHSGHAIWLGSLAAHSAGLLVVATKRMDRRIRRGLKSYLIWRKWVDAAVAISPAVMRQLVEFGVEPGKAHLVCSVADVSHMTPNRPSSAVRDEFGCPPDGVVLLVLGSLHRRKGIDVLFTALHALRPARLPLQCWIAGDGPERAVLERMSEALSLNGVVKFLGQRADTADVLNAADVLVMPSRAEGMGNAALEAMACSKPVIASAVGGLAYSVRDGVTGLLVPPEDPMALAGAIEALTGDAVRRQAMGQSGAARIKAEFTQDRMVSSYLTLYGNLTQAAGRLASRTSSGRWCSPVR